MSILQKKERNINRRDFIKISSALGLTGLGQIACGSDKSQNNIIYRRLGETGIEIPVVSMGTGNCNYPNIVKAAYDRGIKLFATSEYYANGNNEKMLGEALKDKRSFKRWKIDCYGFVVVLIVSRYNGFERDP